jgi:sugar (pentulose or hexulose) kinase
MTQKPPNYEPPLALAIDVGSSSVRASLLDTRAQAIEGAEARAVHLLHSAPDGTAEDNAEHLLQRVGQVIDHVLWAAGPLAREIKAVGIDTLAGTLLGVDAGGSPVTPIYTTPTPAPAGKWNTCADAWMGQQSTSGRVVRSIRPTPRLGSSGFRRTTLR